MNRKHAENLPKIINYDSVEQMFENLYYNLIDIAIYQLERRFDKSKLAPLTAIFDLLTSPELEENIINVKFKNMNIYSDFISLSQLKLELNLYKGYKEHYSNLTTIDQL